MKLEKDNQTRNTNHFKQVFVDSWKKKNILPFIRKMDLGFQIVINNEIRYTITEKKKDKFAFNQNPTIQIN